MLTLNRHDMLLPQCIPRNFACQKTNCWQHRGQNYLSLPTQWWETPKLNLEIARSISPSSVLTARKTKISLHENLPLMFPKMPLLFYVSATLNLRLVLFIDPEQIWPWNCSPIIPALNLKENLFRLYFVELNNQAHRSKWPKNENKGAY